jgi:hypothetical protein
VSPRHRALMFVSHAYPESNTFAEWLMNQLRVAGYEPWLDLSHLTGGERIWPEAEEAIRNSAFRFLFVLSRASNVKRGTVQELNLATKVGEHLGLGDFVIPLTIDDLPPTEYNIQVTELAPIAFASNWATGLHALLQKLEKIDAPKTSRPEDATQLWRARMSGADRLAPAKEPLYSNHFPIKSVPSKLFEFPISSELDGAVIANEASVTSVYSGASIYAFAGDGSVVHPKLTAITPQEHRTPCDQGNGDETVRAAYNAVLALIRESWQRYLKTRGLKPYEMANRLCLFFPSGLLADEKVYFNLGSRHSWRAMMGEHRGSRWHFGLSARGRQLHGLGLSMTSHIVFTNDGAHPWVEVDRQHAARRRLGRMWWNDKWRDLLIASMTWIAGDDDFIAVPSGTAEPIIVARLPTAYVSPVTYKFVETSVDAADDVSTRQNVEDDFDDDDDALDADGTEGNSDSGTTD